MTEPKKLDVQEPETLPEAVFDCPMHGAYSGRSFKMSLFGRTKVYDPPWSLPDYVNIVKRPYPI